MKLKNSAINPSLTIGSSEDWLEESFDSVLLRSTEMGQTLFEQLWKHFPQLKEEIVFLQWSMQPDDVYAVRDVMDGGFVVQIDPLIELVIVWNEESVREFGAWTPNDNPVADALKYLSEIIKMS
jgi:hypothetical protein